MPLDNRQRYLFCYLQYPNWKFTSTFCQKQLVLRTLFITLVTVLGISSLSLVNFTMFTQCMCSPNFGCFSFLPLNESHSQMSPVTTSEPLLDKIGVFEIRLSFLSSTVMFGLQRSGWFLAKKIDVLVNLRIAYRFIAWCPDSCIVLVLILLLSTVTLIPSWL